MKIVYTLFIYLYYFAIHVASLFNPKAKEWIDGRKNIFEKLKSAFQNSKLESQKSKLVWIHCASLGEFEQGRPLIEKLKKEEPQTKILLTFFSPSGYEIRKKYEGADYVFYLPMGTPSAAKKFIEIVKPKVAIFVKYEFWFNYLYELKKHNVATYLICGIFREDQYFFKSYGSWFRTQFSAFTSFFLQDEPSKLLLSSIGFNNTSVAGDTRFDRVFEISKNAKQIDLVKQFVMDKKLIIAGSTWDKDEEIIANFFNIEQERVSNYKLIIAPHEIDEPHIQSIIARFSSTSVIRYSEATQKDISSAHVLIIDNIGLLSSLYQYGTIAFIGGGFGTGIHNVLEAATFGLPIIFGPNYDKFIEAKELINLGGAFSISSVDEFKKTIDLLQQPGIIKMASFVSKNYVASRVGATDKILKSIYNTMSHS